MYEHENLEYVKEIITKQWTGFPLSYANFPSL